MPFVSFPFWGYIFALHDEMKNKNKKKKQKQNICIVFVFIVCICEENVSKTWRVCVYTPRTRVCLFILPLPDLISFRFVFKCFPFAFERVCLLHINQIKEKSDIRDVYIEFNFWYCKKDDDFVNINSFLYLTL